MTMSREGIRICCYCSLSLLVCRSKDFSSGNDILSMVSGGSVGVAAEGFRVFHCDRVRIVQEF